MKAKEKGTEEDEMVATNVNLDKCWKLVKDRRPGMLQPDITL